MDVSRRAFFKTGIAGAVGITVFGFDAQPLLAQAGSLEISRSTETRSTCPYCAVGCGIIIHTLGDKSGNVKPAIFHIEGDADHPTNRGALCSKGITLKQDVVNDRRITSVKYRAPGSEQWEDKSWDFAIDRIAHLLKQARDERFITTDTQGHTVNALTSVGIIGGCTDTNEINYLLVKAFRAGLGIVPMEQQARI